MTLTKHFNDRQISALKSLLYWTWEFRMAQHEDDREEMERTRNEVYYCLDVCKMAQVPAHIQCHVVNYTSYYTDYTDLKDILFEVL